MNEEDKMMDKDKYQESLNDIIKNCKGFPCKNDSFFNMQELIDNSYLEYLRLQEDKNNLQSKIDKAIEYYETHQQECVIGRNRDDKLIKDYYLPSQFSKKLYDILKDVE